MKFFIYFFLSTFSLWVYSSPYYEEESSEIELQQSVGTLFGLAHNFSQESVELMTDPSGTLFGLAHNFSQESVELVTDPSGTLFGLAHNFSQKSSGISSCQQAIKEYYHFSPPLAYVGNPADENYPNPHLMAQKIQRAQDLWTYVLEKENIALAPVSTDSLCVQQIREACWEYCHRGVGHGPLDLYCIFQACTEH